MKAKAVSAVKADRAPVATNVDQPIAAMTLVSARAKAMTPAELKTSLIAAGIVRPDGKLTAAYSIPSKKKAAVKAGAAKLPSKSNK